VKNSVYSTLNLLLRLFLPPDRRQAVGSSEDSDETSHFAKGREFLDWLPLSASQQGFCSMELGIWLAADVTFALTLRSGLTDN
jgi:hypothetical protein